MRQYFSGCASIRKTTISTPHARTLEPISSGAQLTGGKKSAVQKGLTSDTLCSLAIVLYVKMRERRLMHSRSYIVISAALSSFELSFTVQLAVWLLVELDPGFMTNFMNTCPSLQRIFGVLSFSFMGWIFRNVINKSLCLFASRPSLDW